MRADIAQSGTGRRSELMRDMAEDNAPELTACAALSSKLDCESRDMQPCSTAHASSECAARARPHRKAMEENYNLLHPAGFTGQRRPPSGIAIAAIATVNLRARRQARAAFLEWLVRGANDAGFRSEEDMPLLDGGRGARRKYLCPPCRAAEPDLRAQL